MFSTNALPAMLAGLTVATAVFAAFFGFFA
jgi:hypothetical protein